MIAGEPRHNRQGFPNVHSSRVAAPHFCLDIGRAVQQVVAEGLGVARGFGDGRIGKANDNGFQGFCSLLSAAFVNCSPCGGMPQNRSDRSGGCQGGSKFEFVR
jgi:hypothetical protein